MAPPRTRKGKAYRTRVLQILGADFEWGAGYGRPFPSRDKHLAVNRTVVSWAWTARASSTSTGCSCARRGSDTRCAAFGLT